MRKLVSIAAVLLLGASMLSACGKDALGGPGPADGCASDDECGAGWSCDAASGMCLVAEGLPEVGVIPSGVDLTAPAPPPPDPGEARSSSSP